MITLNILPPEEKEIIATQQALRKILVMGSLSLVFILIFLLLLSSIWLLLTVQLKSTEAIFKEAEASAQGKAFQELRKEINKINQQLQNVDQLQNKTRNYSFVLERLTELVPPGIRFKNIFINENDIFLKGHATTREALISFKDVLEKSPYFEEIKSPLSNFLKQREIEFSFSFKIK